MQKKNLIEAKELLNQSDQYRVIKKYNKPEFYNLNADVPKRIGVFLDIELRWTLCVGQDSSKIKI